MLRFREAIPTDAAVVAKLYTSLMADPKISVTTSRLQEIHSDPHNFLFLCEDGSDVCGTVFVTICLDPMYGDQSYALLENIVVSESRRGQAIGKQLLQFVEEFCRKHRCTKIMLLSSAHRQDAHAFFKRVGFDGDKKRGFVNYINRQKE
jgi:GNAT superfamily N-acetyltransferase